MLLTGTFHRTLDEKFRVAIPKRVRDTMVGPRDSATSGDPGVYATPGTDGSLALYTEAALKRLGEQLEQHSPTGQDVRAFSRLFYGQAQRLELDAQGRVRLPLELVTLARLGKEIVLIGVRDHLEVWSKEAWDRYVESLQPHYDQLAESAFRMGGTTTPPPPTAAVSTPAVGPPMAEDPAGETRRPNQPR